MKVVRSGVLGFCMGVRRAVDMATAEAAHVKTSGNGKVYTLGPLIHNDDVNSQLNALGVDELIKPIDDMENTSIIIRAHGIDPKKENDLRERGAKIIDATCPHVKRSQLNAKTLMETGYKLFIAGDADHAEIDGILGYTDSDKPGFFCKVVSNSNEANIAAKMLYETDKNVKTALIGQTTISETEYKSIGEKIIKYFPDLEIVQTICSATKDRQQALLELLEKVEAVLIIGSKKSANTRRLLSIAEESGKPCALVEKPSEIPPFFFSCKIVGLSAGASTPDSVIDDIEKELLC
jgi:4-hydroxy-3-methylbut-2-enyl diphosphate reductase